MNDLSCGIEIWAQVSFFLSQSTRLTDEQKGLGNAVRCITCSRTIKMYTFMTKTLWLTFVDIFVYSSECRFLHEIYVIDVKQSKVHFVAKFG